jgi:hypothetical protein
VNDGGVGASGGWGWFGFLAPLLGADTSRTLSGGRNLTQLRVTHKTSIIVRTVLQRKLDRVAARFQSQVELLEGHGNLEAGPDVSLDGRIWLLGNPENSNSEIVHTCRAKWPRVESWSTLRFLCPSLEGDV